MLFKMIEVAKQNADVMDALKEHLKTANGLDRKMLLTVIIYDKQKTASDIMIGLSEKEFTITGSNGATCEFRSEEVSHMLKSIAKGFFRVKREFTGTWGEATEAYRQYSETHNVGDRWNEGDIYYCYEYLLESKVEYEQQQIEAAQQVAEEASETARNLGGELLVGTPKQQAWAEKIRAEVLAKADKKQSEKLLQQLSAKWWIDYKDLSVAELAKKRITKAKSVEEVQEPTEQPVEFTLEDSQKLIAEKLAEFSEEHIKLCLSDACLGYKNRIDSIFDGTSKFKDRELKAFLLYVG
jgi:hypothetical protein